MKNNTEFMEAVKFNAAASKSNYTVEVIEPRTGLKGIADIEMRPGKVWVFMGDNPSGEDDKLIDYDTFNTGYCITNVVYERMVM